MDKETEIVKKYVQNLSQGIKNYLAKDTWPQKVAIVAQANKLNEEQTSVLKAEIFMILIGMEDYSNFKTNAQKNITGINNQALDSIVDYVEKNIFSEVKQMLEEIEKAHNEAEKTSVIENEKNLSKDAVLHDIENPTPTKPIVSNPAGKNIILDAQHNLPEQEKKVLISSAAVPSRGPILSNIKTSFIAPIAPVKPVEQKPIIQTKPFIPPAPMQPAAPKPASPVTPPQPIQSVQSPKAPQTPPPAPSKYKVDPYREPLE